MTKVIDRIYKSLFILGCMLLLNSCTIKISYRFLDNILGWQISQYVDLKGQQKKEASAALDAFHDWHRETQLPLYVNYLENLKVGMLTSRITATYLHEESNKLQDLLDLSMTQILPSVTSVAATLNEAQIQQVTEKLKKDREEYRRDYIEAPDKKIQKRRIRDLTRYIGGFFGKFNKEQKQRLIAWEESLSAHEELMIDQQKQWEVDFLTAMKFQSDKVELQQRLRNLMLYRTDNWEPELQRRLDRNQSQTFEMLAELFNSQSEKQRQKMEKKFDSYIGDLNDLIKHRDSKPSKNADLSFAVHPPTD